MVKEFMFGTMGQLMKETSRRIRGMATDTLSGVMENHIKVIILKTAELEKANTDGQMALITKDLS